MVGGRQGRGSALLALHVLLGIYSLSDVASKKAAQAEFLSPGFIALYLVVLALLAVYAIGWQQVIKRMAIDLSAGTHDVVLTYRTPGLDLGLALTGAGLLVAVGLVVVYERRAHRPKGD